MQGRGGRLEKTNAGPVANRAGGRRMGGEEGGKSVLQPDGVPVRLCRGSPGELALGRSDGRGVWDTRSLCGVPPDADVLPPSLEDKYPLVGANKVTARCV